MLVSEVFEDKGTPFGIVGNSEETILYCIKSY